MQNGYWSERMAEARHRELVALAQAEQAIRRARRAGRDDVGPWRRALGRALIRGGVLLGLPARRRGPVLRETVALIERSPVLDCETMLSPRVRAPA